jgi:hypothetical protein
VPVPVPDAVDVASVALPVGGGAVVALSAGVAVSVAGVVVVLVSVGTATTWSAVLPEEPVEVESPDVVVTAGGVTVWSLGGVIAAVSAGGVADVSVGGFTVVGVVDVWVSLEVEACVGDWVEVSASDGVTVTFVPARACWSAASAAACGSGAGPGVSFPYGSSGFAGTGAGAGFGSGIGNGRVSGAEIGVSTPTLSSYVGRFGSVLSGFGGAGRVMYAFATTGSVTVRRPERRAAWGTRAAGRIGAL